MARYLLLIWSDEDQWASMSPEEQTAEFRLYTDYTKWLEDKGWVRGGDALTAAAGSVQVRLRDGETLTTDGPFAETKEQLGGYYVIETEGREQAIEAAARCPAAQRGVMEVREIMELEEA